MYFDVNMCLTFLELEQVLRSSDFLFIISVFQKLLHVIRAATINQNISSSVDIQLEKQLSIWKFKIWLISKMFFSSIKIKA